MDALAINTWVMAQRLETVRFGDGIVYSLRSKGPVSRERETTLSSPGLRAQLPPGAGQQCLPRSEGREAILYAYQERTSLRGLTRVFGVFRQTVTAWLKKAQALPPLASTLAPPQKADELELDKMWTFVSQRCNKR